MPDRPADDAPVCVPLPGVTPVDTPSTAPGLPSAFGLLGDRFWARVDVGADAAADVCWKVPGVTVHPQFNIGGRLIAFSRVAWELSGRGPLARVALVSLCANSLCVRPSHYIARAQCAGQPHRSLAETLKRAGGSVGPVIATPAATAPTRSRGLEHVPARMAVAPRPDGPERASGPRQSTPASEPMDAEGLVGVARLLDVPGVAVWRTPFGGYAHVFTPWGTFEHDDTATALRHARDARPAAVAAA